MITSIFRLFKGETIFLQTTVPQKYSVGSVIAIDVGKMDKSMFRVTAVTKSTKSSLHSVWGTELVTSVAGGKSAQR